MGRHDEIFLVKEDVVQSLPGVEMREGLFGERLEAALQGLLQNYPELIPGKQIEPDSDDPPRFVLLRREMPVSGMSLDHLFVDQRSVLTLVESKLIQNPESRRSVVGQIIEYAANAYDYWASGAARQYAAEYWNQHGRDLDDVLRDAFGEELDTEAFWGRVESNLRQGRIRMIVAADELRPEVRRMVEYLNGEMQNTEVLGLELKCYGSDSDSVVMVPTIIGRSETSRRAKIGASSQQRHTTQEELFAGLSDEAFPVFREIIDRARDLGMTVYWGTKGISVRTPNADGQLTTILYAYPPETYNREHPIVQASGTYVKDVTIRAQILEKLLPLPKASRYGDNSVEVAVVGDGVETAREAADLMFSFKDQIAGGI